MCVCVCIYIYIKNTFQNVQPILFYHNRKKYAMKSYCIISVFMRWNKKKKSTMALW